MLPSEGSCKEHSRKHSGMVEGRGSDPGDEMRAMCSGQGHRAREWERASMQRGV